MTLEELAANAAPATETEALGAWLLRASPELPFRRCSSVAVRGPDAPTDLDERIDRAAEFARRHGVRLRFQLDPGAHPAVDAELERRGFVIDAPVEVMTARLSALLAIAPPGPSAHVHQGVDECWTRRRPAADERTAAYVRMLGRLQKGPVAIHATATCDGLPAGIGFGVVERGWLGVFGMLTSPPFRRRGVATAVIGALAGWAVERTAHHVYLQVELDNEPARALYRRLGFAPHQRYHYRADQNGGSTR